MKRKQYISVGMILTALLLGVACQNELEITPRQALPTDDVFTSSDNVVAVLIGAYSDIKGTFGTNEGGELYGGDFNIMSELLGSSGDVRWGGSFSTYREFDNKAITTTNILVRDNWFRSYEALNTVNLILMHLDVVDEAFRPQVEGEALAIRGLVHFDLVRFWAQPWVAGTDNNKPGIPLKLTPTVTEEDAEVIQRATVAEVYAQVIEDLTQARDLLVPYDQNGTRISSYTVSAILSRVYLQQSEFAKAAMEADRVIASGLYSLVDEPLKAFNNQSNTTEDIFALQLNSNSNVGDGNTGLTTFYARLNGVGRGDMQVQPQHLAKYEAGDLRKGLDTTLAQTATIVNVDSMFYIGVGGQNAGSIQVAKYGNVSTNIPVVRLAEMYLTRAEGNFEAGVAIGATPTEDINVIRQRAGLLPLATPVTREQIRQERSLELAFEGFALHDIKRWQLPVGDLPYDAPVLVLPVPEAEIEASGIEQNPGY